MIGQLLEAIVRRGLASGTSLIATSYLAHQFATSALGTFLGMLALSQLLVIVCSLGLEISPAYMLRSHPDHARRIWLISTATSLALAVACVVIGATALAVVPALGFGSSKFMEWGVAPFVAASASIAMVPQLACLQGLLRLRSYNVMQVAFPLSFLLLVIAADYGNTSLTPKLTIYLWAVASATTATVAACMLLPMLLTQVRASGPVSPLHGRAFLGFSVQSYVANCIGTLNSRLPTMIAPLVLAPVAGGQFAGTVLLGDVFSFFSLAIASVTFPLFAGAMEPAERLARLGRACRLNTSATLAAVITFLLLFEPLCGMLLGSSFVTTDFRLMSALVLLCAVAHSTARLLCTDFSARGKPLMSAIPNVPAAGVFALSFIILHGWAEPWGAVLSLCASSVCFSVLTVLLYRRRFNIDIATIGLATRTDLMAAFAVVQRRHKQRQA